MFESISSYFTFSTLVPILPLDEAMRKGNYSEVDRLLEEGANPAEKDLKGFTPIDHAIFDGNASKVPKLFNRSIDTEYFRPTLSQSIGEFMKSQEAQRHASHLALLDGKKLADPESNDSKFLRSFLQSNFDSFLARMYHLKPVHLIALYAKPEVLEFLVAQPDNFLQYQDKFGNSPLHYAAYNKDQRSFTCLAKAGLNIFARNAEKATPIGILVARIEEKNPFRFDKSDLLIFSADWFPHVVKGLFSAGIIDEFDKTGLLNIADLLKLVGSYHYATTVLKSFSTRSRAVLFALTYMIISNIPIINLPLRAYSTYVFAKRVVDSLGVAYESWNRGTRVMRSISNVVVRSSNAYGAFSDLFSKCLDAFNSARSIYDNWDSQRFVRYFDTIKDEGFQGFFEKILIDFLNSLDLLPEEPCVGYKTPENLNTLSNVDRIRIIGNPSGSYGYCTQKAVDILKINGACDSSYKKAYRQLARELHPDKFKADDAGDVFASLGAAYEVVEKERNLQC